MLIDTSYGKIITIPEADDIFTIVPQNFIDACGHMQAGLFAYLKYGCGSCHTSAGKIKMRGLERLKDAAKARKVDLVYIDLSFLPLSCFVQERMIDKLHTFVLYKDGKEVARHEGFPFADDLADLIEQNFPVQ